MNVLSTRINQPYAKVVQKVKEFAEEAIVLQNDSFVRVQEVDDFNLYKINPSVPVSELPQWPMVIDTKIDGERYYLIDARSYESVTRLQQPTYYKLLIERARALRAWYEDPLRFDGIKAQIVSVYMDWCSGIVRSNAGLDALQLAKYEIMFGLYMFGAIQARVDVHADTGEIINEYKQLLNAKLRYPRQVVDEVFEGDNGMIIISAVQEAFEDGLGTSSLDNILSAARVIVDTNAITLDHAALLHLSEKSWMGDNAVLLSMTAIEHPAILASLISTASVNPIFRRSRIGQAVEGLKRRRLDATSVHKALAR